MRKVLFTAVALLLIGQIAMAQDMRRRPNGARRMAPVKKEMALQLYSIREVMGSAEKYAEKHKEVFKQLHDWGYTAVEAANYNDGKFYGVSPEQYKKDCEEAGLKPISSHTTRGLNDEELANHDFTEALKWWKKAIKDHKAAGMEYIVTPGWGVPKTLKDAQTLCDYANEIGKMCREAGLKYGYHNHAYEFQKVEGEVWIDYMMQHVDAENMFWQMDELGASGFVGFDAIFGAADVAGLENYVVEMEDTDGTIDIMEGVRRCAEYLKRSRFVRPSYSK